MLDLYERGESVEFALARLQAEQNDREFLAYPGKMSREERRRLLPRSLSQYEVQVMLELEQLLRRNPRRPRLTDFAMLPPDRWKDSPDPTLLDLGVSTAVGAASAPAGVAGSLGQGMLRESEAREREQAEQGSYRGIPVPDAQR